MDAQTLERFVEYNRDTNGFFWNINLLDSSILLSWGYDVRRVFSRYDISVLGFPSNLVDWLYNNNGNGLLCDSPEGCLLWIHDGKKVEKENVNEALSSSNSPTSLYEAVWGVSSGNKMF